MRLSQFVHGIVPTSPEKEDKEYARVRKQINDMEDKLLSLLFRRRRIYL